MPSCFIQQGSSICRQVMTNYGIHLSEDQLEMMVHYLKYNIFENGVQRRLTKRFHNVMIFCSLRFQSLSFQVYLLSNSRLNRH